MPSFPEITTAELFKLSQQQGKLHVIDVRELDEFSQASATISRNLPLSQLTDVKTIESLGIGKQESIYMICRSGKRSLAACEIFAQQGYQSLFNVTGGMLAWQADKLPIRG